MRSYDRKKGEFEKWVEKETREIKMTKKHFMQGCLRLSSLLDNYIKDQYRMKEAVKSIRGEQSSVKHNSEKSMSIGVRRSHSFDSEILKQEKNLQSSLLGHIPDLGLNTSSSRRDEPL